MLWYLCILYLCTSILHGVLKAQGNVEDHEDAGRTTSKTGPNYQWLSAWELHRTEQHGVQRCRWVWHSTVRNEEEPVQSSPVCWLFFLCVSVCVYVPFDLWWINFTYIDITECRRRSSEWRCQGLVAEFQPKPDQRSLRAGFPAVCETRWNNTHTTLQHSCNTDRRCVGLCGSGSELLGKPMSEVLE